jgi:hypothetical protein
MSTRGVVVHGMWGIGDNIYQRPLIRQLARERPIFLDTPWPELYEDIPDVSFILRQRALRTQMKNVARQPASRWTPTPTGLPMLTNGYNFGPFDTIPSAMAKALRSQIPPRLDLPPIKTPWPKTDKPIAVVRPVTLRKEWFAESRNPLPEYIYDLAWWLMDTHHVIVVADIDNTNERLVGTLPPGHQTFVHGELDIDRLLGLLAAADVLVGGVGFLVPAAVATQARSLIVLGGYGGHNSPDRILYHGWQHRIAFIKPDRFCGCTLHRHNCDKTISNLGAAFEAFKRGSVGTLVPGSATSPSMTPPPLMTLHTSITLPDAPTPISAVD